jgi:hypothetical protein
MPTIPVEANALENIDGVAGSLLMAPSDIRSSDLFVHAANLKPDVTAGDAVPSVPVVAAGGIADGRTVVAALALGAASFLGRGVFVATPWVSPSHVKGEVFDTNIRFLRALNVRFALEANRSAN